MACGETLVAFYSFVHKHVWLKWTTSLLTTAAKRRVSWNIHAYIGLHAPLYHSSYILQARKVHFVVYTEEWQTVSANYYITNNVCSRAII